MDRKIIKWTPFDSVINSKKVIKEITHERERISKPILSEDQLKYIEDSIRDAYTNKDIININYYEAGYIHNIKSNINKIDYLNKIVYLNNKLLYFNQIISANLNT